jgi:KDO2-lipid IV(A) lauroyltransferase
VKRLGGYWLFRVLAGLFGLLPEPAMRWIGERLGWLMSFVARERMALLERHLGRVFAGSNEDLTRRARGMFASYGRYWAEVFWIQPRRKAEFVATARVDGLDNIEAAKASGRGIVLALPHLGNWEAAGAKAEDVGIPVLAVAESLPNPLITDWFIDVRRHMGIDVVLTGRGHPRTTPVLVERIESGGTVALLADRDLSGRGIEVEFFGERTTIPAGPVSLAERTGAVLLPVGCYFMPGPGHLFVVHPPLELPADGTVEERVSVGAQRLAGVLEDIIRRAPEQWHLFQPNWPSDRREVE